ncbi:hypothetical protein [Psychrobacillus sp. FSL H8-0484]|uniref:hypothetical protein n=1 Tax=Psychrobacillus sp. FSL H8-0484 TaxID=2921390 RepID=UPI004046ACED
MRLACLHAHHSNIANIETALLAPFDIELVHFVDPGLMNRVTHDDGFEQVNAEHKVKEQMEWMAKCT